MHKMYRIKTSSGDYAVKLLNPVIMQRGDEEFYACRRS